MRPRHKRVTIAFLNRAEINVINKGVFIELLMVDIISTFWRLENQTHGGQQLDNEF